jgi:phage recombination protein Bet
VARNNDYAERNARNEQALMVVQPPRLPMPVEAEREHALSLPRWRALVDAVFPSAKSVSGVLLALDYCKSRNLDPFKRVVHIVPMWSTKLGREVETVWPGIGEVCTTASRTGIWAGTDECQFGKVERREFRAEVQKEGRNGKDPYSVAASCPVMEFPDWAQITVYKIVQGQRVAFVGPKVRFMETFSGQKGLRVPNDRWQLAPYQMLEKCALAASLRRAFPDELGDEWTAEEMAGKETHANIPDAEIVTVGNAKDVDHVQDGGVEQDQGDDQQQNVGIDWNDERIAEEVDYFKRGLAQMKTLEQIDTALEGEQQAIDALPQKVRNKIDDLIERARKRVSEAAAAAAAKEGEAVEQAEQPKTTPEEQQQAAEPTDAEPAFVRNLRLRMGECETMVDLNSASSAERRAIEAQPEPIQTTCWAIIDARRDELRPAPQQ